MIVVLSGAAHSRRLGSQMEQHAVESYRLSSMEAGMRMKRLGQNGPLVSTLGLGCGGMSPQKRL